MGSGRSLFAILLLTLVLPSFSQSVIKILPENRNSGGFRRGILKDDDLFCDSWRFSVETNDAGSWKTVPSRCLQFMRSYMTGDRYLSDVDIVAANSLEFVKSEKFAGDGKDAWVFDIDETLLSNLPYYEAHGFGSELFDEATFDEWVRLAKAPALSASLVLYKELKQMGFAIFLLTGRSEPQRNATEKNLLFAGYTGWEKLILRGTSDQGLLATVYKSGKRKEIEDAGYRIQGNSGDQWSDLLGFSLAERSFKLPNPMYYIA